VPPSNHGQTLQVQAAPDQEQTINQYMASSSIMNQLKKLAKPVATTGQITRPIAVSENTSEQPHMDAKNFRASTNLVNTSQLTELNRERNSFLEKFEPSNSLRQSSRDDIAKILASFDV